MQWNLLARLGEGGFDSPQAAGAFIILLTQTRAPAPEGFALHGVDASAPKSAPEKALLLREGAVVAVSQKGQLDNPEARVMQTDTKGISRIGDFCSLHEGMSRGDTERSIEAIGKYLPPCWESAGNTL